jgi:hypothetical protein
LALRQNIQHLAAHVARGADNSDPIAHGSFSLFGRPASARPRPQDLDDLHQESIDGRQKNSPIETDIIRKSYPQGSAKREAFARQVSMGRFGTPAEIAHACAYVLSDEAGFTTGQVLYVCGGMSVGQAPD